MTAYTIKLRHHSIARSRLVRYEGTLAGAKRRASSEFGGENRAYTIAIDDESLGYYSTVALRLVSERRWHTVEEA